MDYLIIILIIFLVYLLFFHQNNNQEKFTNKYIANDHIYLGHRRDPYDLLDDSLFTTVVTFNNDDDPYSNDGQTAIQKCLQNCPKGGKCVEFGPGFSSFCYPPENIAKDRFETVNSRIQ